MNDAQTRILVAIVGMVVFTIIAIAIQTSVVEAQEGCFKSLETSYPNLSCGFAGIMYCEWENQTYKVIGHFTNNESWCSLELY